MGGGDQSGGRYLQGLDYIFQISSSWATFQHYIIYIYIYTVVQVPLKLPCQITCKVNMNGCVDCTDSFSRTEVFTTHTHTHTHTQNTCMHIQLENLHLMLYLQSTGGNSQKRVMFLNMKVRAKHFVYYEQCSQHDKKVLKAILCFSADGGLILEDVPLVEFMYLVFTRMPGDNYQRQLESLLLHLCYIF